MNNNIYILLIFLLFVYINTNNKIENYDICSYLKYIKNTNPINVYNNYIKLNQDEIKECNI